MCEGYAEAFKLLCDKEGIPCITVMGTGNGGAHKWNMVQMEDNEWYTLDVTWDDQSNYIYYSYFLIGSDTKATFFQSSVADSTIHIPSGKMFSTANTALTYPTLSTDTYGVAMLRYGAKDVHIDTTRGVIIVGKDVTNYLTYFVSNTTRYTNISWRNKNLLISSTATSIPSSFGYPNPPVAMSGKAMLLHPYSTAN